ncbi:MAG: hypothetical protein SGJ00_05145 [bacterium]|nr:hypothetical protein [bacterium]
MKKSKATTITTCIRSNMMANPVVTLGICINLLDNEASPKTMEIIPKILKPLLVNFSNKKNTMLAINVGTML